MDQYLRKEYLDDKHELSKLSDLIDEVGPVLVRSFDQERRAWPYELQSGHPWVLDKKKYSYSTNAMILFALAAASNRVRASVLAPALRPRKRPLTGEPVNVAITDGWKRLKEMCRNKKSKFTESGSFGQNDPFTIAWLIELLACSDMGDDAAFATETRTVASDLVKGVLQSPSQPVLFRVEKRKDIPEHAFPLLRVIQLCKALDPETEKWPDTTEVRRYLTGRLHHQLSSSAVRGSNFDPAELAFALEGILQLDPGSIDAPLLGRVFAVVTDSQERNPYWRPVKPFVSTPQGMALLPLSVEIANSLIRSCTLLDGKGDGREGYFNRHVGLFKRYANWLSSRIVRGRAMRRDAQASPDEEITFVGWHSEHVDLPDRVHLWETSQVLTFLVNYEWMLRRHVGFRALTEVGLSVNYAITRQRSHKEKEMKEEGKITGSLSCTDYWKEVGDKKDPLAGLADASIYRVAARIRERFVQTREPTAPRSPAWSMLLYGPPGTGKTGIAEDLAAALEFPLVTVTPSDFIRRGEAEVEARAKDIFDALGEQTDMVVLFDEIDRLILDRDSKDYRGQGDIFQLMTPSMLPKLKDLRSKEQVIFVVATNYTDRIDPAAKRTGRIDYQFFVAPPDLKNRADILRFRLKKEVDAVWGNKHDWFKVVGSLTPNDLEVAAKQSALAVYTELVYWVREVVRGLPDAGVEKKVLIEYFKKVYDLLPPGTVRLLSYSSRFRQAQKDVEDEGADKKDEAFPSSQEPFDEFLLLLYLKLEAEQTLDEAEKKLAKRVVGRLVNPAHLNHLKAGGAAAAGPADEVRNALSDEIRIRDQQVVALILDKAAEWLPG